MIKIHPQTAPETIHAIAREGVPHEATSIYKARNEVFTLPTPEGVLNIKAFHTPKFPNSYIYTNLRQSKARRSFDNAVRLIDLGFHTPAPIAYIEEKSCGALRRSYYISAQLPLNNVRDWTEIPDYERLVDDLGAEMHRLVTKGVFHRDFSPGNILYERMADGRFRFYYVDLNRMEFNVTSKAKLMRMFRAITFDTDQLALLARAYARAACLDAGKVVAEALEQHRRYLAEKRRLKALKSLFK